MPSASFTFNSDDALIDFMDAVRSGLPNMRMREEIQVSTERTSMSEGAMTIDEQPDAESLRRSGFEDDENVRAQSVMGWEHDRPTGIREAVGQAIGRASMCWAHPAKAGEFQSRDAQEIVNELIDWLQTEWVAQGVQDQLAKMRHAERDLRSR